MAGLLACSERDDLICPLCPAGQLLRGSAARALDRQLGAAAGIHAGMVTRGVAAPSQPSPIRAYPVKWKAGPD